VTFAVTPIRLRMGLFVKMAEKHPKRPRDQNQLAKSIIDLATGQKPDRDPTP